MTEPAAHDSNRRLALVDGAARRPEPLGQRLGSVAPMTVEQWDALAVDDLTEHEANAFWQAIAR